MTVLRNLHTHLDTEVRLIQILTFVYLVMAADCAIFADRLRPLRASLSSNINRLPWIGWPASRLMQSVMEAWHGKTEGECGTWQRAKPRFALKYLIY